MPGRLLFADPAGDSLGESLKVSKAVLDSPRMPTDSPVRRPQREHGLTRFLRHRHKASKVLERGEAVGIVTHCDAAIRLLIANCAGINARYAIHPSRVSHHRTIKTDRVLHDYVADWPHRAPR